MKHSLVLYVILFGVFLNTNAFAQQTSVAIAQATILQPINLIQVRDMSFGNISAGETSGTVVLAPTEASTRSVSGGVTLPSGSGTVYSAKFIVSGGDDYTFTIVLPSTPITLSNETNFMTIDNFTSTPSGSGTFASGSQTICVGATLNVNANQETGIYETTEEFEVTVNYN